MLSRTVGAGAGAGAETKGDERGRKQVMVVLVGPPGSGKSTFADAVVGGSTAGRHWVRVCQVGSPSLLVSAFNAYKCADLC